MDVMRVPRPHGGPDARGPLPRDFSTNVNACGPCPMVVAAVSAADATRYPDPRYIALKARLADFHGVDASRILVAASASEFIQRITAVGQRIAPGPVEAPARSYGDYAVAARVCGRALVRSPAERSDATLRWCCDPGSPTGQDAAPPADVASRPTVLDAAYAPLRLTGRSAWSTAALDGVFRLYTPNKAIGLPGVRGAYAIAPLAADWPIATWRAALDDAEPSWPLGAHAVTLLERWTDPSTQAWLDASRPTLRAWTAALRDGLAALGLAPLASVTPFLCASRPAHADDASLRAAGIAVRDTASFGLPGRMRVSAQPPDAVAALLGFLARESP